MKAPPNGVGASNVSPSSCEGGEKPKSINPELWQACAGPLVNLPAAGTHVVYFPQGHSEQVAASMKKDIDAQIPNYPNLPPKLLCILHNVTLHADPETDEVYAQMTLQPVPSFDKDALLRSDLTLKVNKPQPEFFCKTLTASDTSTHGGFSVPRRAAEKIFQPLDYSMQPPAQEIVARDLHDTIWNFRHIYRGQPKRHLLTTGWSLFVSGKKLFAGDSVLFIRDEKQQLLLGIRRAHRQPTHLSSSVLSSDSMHIGILAAAAHAAANNSPFTVFYNPRASPSEFVIPLAKYYKAVYGNQISLGMRFRMMFETEDSGTRRYMGTITGISDIDPLRWKSSQWRNLQVNWDESTAGEKRNRVSIWEIEPVTAPFFIYPPPLFRSKRPRQLGMPDDESSEFENLFKRMMPWLGDDISVKDPQAHSGLSLVQWMNMQQNSPMANIMQPNSAMTNLMQPNFINSFSGSILQNLAGADLSRQFGLSVPQMPQTNNLQFNAQMPPQQVQQPDQLAKPPSTLNTLGPVMQPQEQMDDLTQNSRQNFLNQTILPSSQAKPQNFVNQTLPTNQVQPQILAQTNNILQPQQSIQSHQIHKNIPQDLQSLQQQQVKGQNQQNHFQHELPEQVNPQLSVSERFQLLQKLQQQQSLLAQQSLLQPTTLNQLQEQQRQQSNVSQCSSRPVVSSQMLEMPQSSPGMVLQSNAISQQMSKNNSMNAQFPHPSQQLKLQQQQTGRLPEIPGDMGVPWTSSVNTRLSAADNGMITGAAGTGKSGITDDVPSCSTSPTTNNSSSVLQPLINITKTRQNTGAREEIAHSGSTLFIPSALENMSSSATVGKDLQHKPDVKPSLNVTKDQSHGFFSPQTYPNGGGGQMDYLDTSSSTSVCLSQNDVHLQQKSSMLPYNPQSMLRDVSQESEILAQPRNSGPYGKLVPGSSDPSLTKGLMGLGTIDPSNNLTSGGMLASYENSKDGQREFSSSMVSQSFGVPDMAFDPIDPPVDDNNFLSSEQWAPPLPPQFQRMRTYTKVYKRGAVGRSIDVTRYSGYDELKQDLARRFGIEGQLEDGQRVGWKLVYVDHENDVLLLGDDPWEEFVNCVRCIKILSPQEVQQMSLEGDFGNSVLPNQACSSSDVGNA